MCYDMQIFNTYMRTHTHPHTHNMAFSRTTQETGNSDRFWSEERSNQGKWGEIKTAPTSSNFVLYISYIKYHIQKHLMALMRG